MGALRQKLRQLCTDTDMCSGPLLTKIILYTLPIMCTGLLQLFYNAADIIVVGRYVGKTALAAVGSTSSFINLLVNLFLGLSVGVSVAVAQGYGAHDYDAISETAHTAVLSSLFAGLFVGILGYAISRPCLLWMDCPPDVIDQATLYLHIYFFGVPGVMLYNFGAGILRAVGDTRRPLLFLSVSGLINVLLNLLFVIRLRMDVAGVALATVISQYVAALLTMLSLCNAAGPYHIDPVKLRIHKKRLAAIVTVGLPAGLQSAVFSVSNMLIQSNINGFGSVAMAGNSAASNLDSFVYTAMNSVSQASMTFTGQNIGARRYERLGRINLICITLSTCIGLVFGFFVYAKGNTLLALYNGDPEVIRYGMIRLSVICTTYFLCGIMDSLVGCLRGMGESLLPMLVTVIGACGFRIVWIYTVFAIKPTLPVLYASYPVSWLITALAHTVCLIIIKKKRFSNAVLMESL